MEFFITDNEIIDLAKSLEVVKVSRSQNKIVQKNKQNVLQDSFLGEVMAQ